MQPPIASPFGPSEVPRDEERRVFRPNLWGFWMGEVVKMAFLAAPLIYGVFWLTDPQTFVGRGPDFLAKLIFFLVALVPIVEAGLLMLFPISVSRQGVQMPLGNGFVEWQSIESVRRNWLGGAKVKLHHRFGSLYLPLPLADFPAFARTLEEWAPEGNPLREWALKRAGR